MSFVLLWKIPAEHWLRFEGCEAEMFESVLTLHGL